MYEYEVEVTYQYTDRVTADSKDEALDIVRSRIRTDDIERSFFELSVIDISKVSEV